LGLIVNPFPCVWLAPWTMMEESATLFILPRTSRRLLKVLFEAFTLTMRFRLLVAPDFARLPLHPLFPPRRSAEVQVRF
jgi:hypothetical protein